MKITKLSSIRQGLEEKLAHLDMEISDTRYELRRLGEERRGKELMMKLVQQEEKKRKEKDEYGGSN